MEALLRKKNPLVTAAILAPLFFAFIIPASAQTPNIGGAIEQAAPPRKEEPKAPPEGTPIIVEKEEAAFSMPDGGTRLIKVFRIENSKEEDWFRLQDLLAPNRFKEMTMADIMKAASQVTAYYRNKGYMLAKAYVPPQDAANGVLTIRILFGEYGKISVKNASAIRTSFLKGVFEKPREKSPVVRRDSLERAMLLTQAMPGGRIPMISITRGEKAGTSDFLVEMEGSRRLGGYAMANNQGSKYTGEYRTFGGADVNSLFGVADKLSVSYMTTDTTDLRSYQIAYDFPLAANGLRAEASVARTTYELGGAYSALGATGTANIVEGKISYPIRKRREETIEIYGKLAYKRMADDIAVGNTTNPRNSTTTTLALGREAYSSLCGRSLYTKISGGLDFGSLNITDKVQAAVDSAGPDTAGMYSKFRLDATSELGLIGRLSARASVQWQKILSKKNVDSTEQFFISGSGGVRAYTESVGFDNGYEISAELRYTLPGAEKFRHSLGFFMDNGRAWAQKGRYTAVDEFVLTDVGPRYSLNYRWFFGGVHVAIPVGNSRGIRDPGVRTLWQAGISF